jgi:hypothetical protein
MPTPREWAMPTESRPCLTATSATRFGFIITFSQVFQGLVAISNYDFAKGRRIRGRTNCGMK